MNVACVYRTGGDFDRRWVHALKRALNRTNPGHRFFCLSDDPGIEWYHRVRLKYPLPGWWSKLELFRPGALPEGEPVVYVDLDTLPVGDLSAIASYGGRLAMLSDFYAARRDPRTAPAQSGVMVFTPGDYTRELWEAFFARHREHIRKFRGDGEWLNAHTKPDRLQDLFPGQIVSYKIHATKGPPKGARLVCGHGKPRFSDPAAGWAHQAWASLYDPELPWVA